MAPFRRSKTIAGRQGEPVAHGKNTPHLGINEQFAIQPHVDSGLKSNFLYSHPSHKAKPTVKKIQKSFKLPLTKLPEGCIMGVIVQDVCNSSCTKRIEVLHVH